jgi:hypothetical protein
MLAQVADSVLTYDPDHARPRLGFIQGVQILAEGGNDGFVLENEQKRMIYRTNAIHFRVTVAQSGAFFVKKDMDQLESSLG